MGVMYSPEKVDATIRRGEEWLENNKQTFISETEVGISFRDNFADLLILQLSNRWCVTVPAASIERFDDRRNSIGTMWIFEFQTDAGITSLAIKPVIVPEDYPNDNDTNAVAFSILKPTQSRAETLLDEILACENSDGIIQVHLDPNRPRIAPEVTANILALFYIYGRGYQVQGSLKYLEKAMALEEYQESRYYFLPEPLFFYTWRFLCMASGSSALVGIDNKRLPLELHSLRDHLVRRVTARIGTATDSSLCLAIRVLTCQSLAIANPVDVQALIDLQQDSGDFGHAWYVRYGSVGVKISHRAFACVAAVVALRRLRQSTIGAKTAVVNGVNGETVGEHGIRA